MTLDLEKFELDLETTRAIFPYMGIEQFINRTEGINFITSNGLLFSNMKEAPATSCQRNSPVSQGPDTHNISSYFLDETVESKRKPDYSSFHPEEIDNLKGFYRPVDITVPHDKMV